MAVIATFRVNLLAAAAITIGAVQPCDAQSLEGRWEFSWQGPDGTYAGTMEIDSQGRARLAGTTSRQDFTECGHVLAADGKVELIFTSAAAPGGYSPDHFYCTSPADHRLSCKIEDAAGRSGSGTFTRVRRGKAAADEPASPVQSVECPGSAPRVSRVGNRPKMDAGPTGDFDRKRTVKAGEQSHARDAERA